MDVFSLVMRLKEEGAAQVKTSVDKLDQSMKQATASATALDNTSKVLSDTQKGTAAQATSLGSSMGTLVQDVVNATSATGQFGTTLGALVVSEGLITGVLAGISAIGSAYRFLTEDTRKLKEEQDAAVNALTRIATAQRLGVGGELTTQISTAGKRLAALKQELAQAETKARQVVPSAYEAKVGANLAQQAAAAEIIAAKERVKVLTETIAAGERELVMVINEANRGASMARSEELRDLVKANRATLEEQQEFITRRLNIENQLYFGMQLSASKRRELIDNLAVLTLEEEKVKKPKAPKPLKLAKDITELGTSYMQQAKLPLQELEIPVMPKIVLPPEVQTGTAGVFAKVGAEFVNGWATMMDQAADQMANILVDSIAGAFENLTAVGGTIKSAFKVLTSGLLSGLGSMLIEFGRYVIVAGKLMAAVRESLRSMNPIAAVAAGVAMIAIGGMLRGAASRAFGGQSVGGAAGGVPSSAMAAGGSMGLPTQFYGPTAAGSASTIERVSPVNVTIIGPNDPTAQRQMQELVRNAQRRGNV